MWHRKKVSVALPTFRERKSIYACIEGFFNTGVVDEVVVCNNNAEAGTAEEVAKTKARQVFEQRQGYGASCRKALSETSGDLIVLCEPDGSFEPQDIFKLLAYADRFDLVLGSRTNSQFIWRGANMGWFLRWGNWIAAKLLEFLFNTPCLTDMGCTMRLLKREALQKIQPFFTVSEEHFGPEMVLLGILSGAQVVEIPLNYKPRVGKSQATGNRRNAFLIGLRMITLILRYRLLSWFAAGPCFNRGEKAAQLGKE